MGAAKTVYSESNEDSSGIHYALTKETLPFLRIYSGVHVECSDGTLDCITWIEQRAGFKYIHLRAGSEGTVGGCKPGTGSRGHWKFAEVPGLGFTASTQGNLRVSRYTQAHASFVGLLSIDTRLIDPFVLCAYSVERRRRLDFGRKPSDWARHAEIGLH